MKLYDPINYGKPQIRLPQDDEWDGGNPYAEGAVKPPMKDWQIAGRDSKWWGGVTGGAMAWLLTRMIG